MSNKLKVCAIIEARIGSERLPGKVLIPVLGKSILQHIIERSNSCKYVDETILAIPDTKDNDILEKFAFEKSVTFYRGSENNVLERFYLAAKENNSDVIVRMPGDDPLIDPEIIDLVISKHLNTDADYSCTEYPDWFLPRGLGVEVFSFKALEKSYKESKKDYEKEHVALHFIENPNSFKFNAIVLPEHLKNPTLRLTLDTKEDLELITKIYQNLYKEGEIFKTEEVLNLIIQNPELRKINDHIVQRIK